MKKLAIKGHATRGKEVIELLEMLGGKNPNRVYSGKDTFHYYYIDNETSYITTKLYTNNCLTQLTYNIFNLEEFLEKFPYKVGDRVKIPNCYVACRVTNMIWNDIEIEYETTNSEETFFADELRPYKKETKENKPNLLQQLKEYFDNTPREVIEKEWHEYDKYNKIGPTVNDYLEYVNKSRQPQYQYPKTYEECCDILQLEHTFELKDLTTDEEKLMDNFIRLKRCRDAYWKLYGELMGLGKPWSPSKNDNVYCIFRFKGEIIKDNFVFGDSLILEFPTEEIRDAFYENFKDLIEECKNLL